MQFGSSASRILLIKILTKPDFHLIFIFMKCRNVISLGRSIIFSLVKGTNEFQTGRSVMISSINGFAFDFRLRTQLCLYFSYLTPTSPTHTLSTNNLTHFATTLQHIFHHLAHSIMSILYFRHQINIVLVFPSSMNLLIQIRPLTTQHCIHKPAIAKLFFRDFLFFTES